MLHPILKSSEAVDFQMLWMQGSKFHGELFWIQEISAHKVILNLDWATQSYPLSAENTHKLGEN